MRKNKLFTITIICLGLVTACTDQDNDNLKGNKSAIEDTANSEIEEFHRLKNRSFRQSP